ncbi:MAG: ABC transporter permease [Candidatus Thorarchaeota archaeon]|nr:ABC transporter permease [Candidatus Thorarchaeota archaeon]
MSRLNQIIISFQRSTRIFLRDKAIFGSAIGTSIFFLIILPLVMFQDVPPDVMPMVKGYVVIALVTLTIMTIGISNLAGSIASDREHGLYAKIASMPVNPLLECSGRILTVLVYAGLGGGVVVLLGVLMGAQFVVSALGILKILLIAATVTITSAGIGLILASVVKSESAASHVGIAIVLVNYFIGIAIPYPNLPELLRPFVSINPLTLGNLMMVDLALGHEYVGFDPITLPNLAVLLVGTGLLLCIGLVAYLRKSWPWYSHTWPLFKSGSALHLRKNHHAFP